MIPLPKSSAHFLSTPWARHLRVRVAVALLAGVSLALLACGARGSALEVEPDTPLRELHLAVLTHPEKADAPETDENVHFHDYVAGLDEEDQPFASITLTDDRRAVDADIYVSLNLDINYVKQVSRWAYLPKILTLWLYNVFGFPNSLASAHYNLSAVLYDRDASILNAFYVHEPVTFAWKNIYWEPEPEDPDSLRFVFNRLLAEMDREMRHWQRSERALGSFGHVVPAAAPPVGDDNLSEDDDEHNEVSE